MLEVMAVEQLESVSGSAQSLAMGIHYHGGYPEVRMVLDSCELYILLSSLSMLLRLWSWAFFFVLKLRDVDSPLLTTPAALVQESCPSGKCDELTRHKPRLTYYSQISRACTSHEVRVPLPRSPFLVSPSRPCGKSFWLPCLR